MSTENLSYDLIRRIEALEGGLRQAHASTPGYQLLPDGTPFFPSLRLSDATAPPIFEPPNVPSVRTLVLSTGANFDTVYIDASWGVPVGFGADQIGGYVVQTLRQGSTIPIETPVNPGSTSCRIEPVEPGTTYTVTVNAQSRIAGRLAPPVSGTITTGKDNTIPAAVTFPANAVLPMVQGLAIKWNSNTERDVAAGAGAYRIIISTAANLSNPVRDYKETGLQSYPSGLTVGTPYYIGIRAVDSSGNESPVVQPPGGPWTPLPIVTEDLALSFGGGNIARNSGFEDTQFPKEWVVGANGATIVKATTVSHGPFGSSSAWMTGTATNCYLQQNVPLTLGTWIVSAWVKGQDLTGPGLGAVLNWQLLSGTYTNDSVVMGGTADNVSRVVAGRGTFDWKRVAFKLTITSPTAMLAVYLQRGYNAASGGSVFWDEVQVEMADTISAYSPKANEIGSGTITSVEIADNAITAPKITAGAVVAGKIAANAIGAVEIAARSITANNIATGTITSSEIAAATITAGNLSANSVTADKLAANSVSAGKITAGTIGTDKLAVALGLVVGQYIQSTGFVAGSAGWRIGGDGNAEFNGLTVRGSQWVGGSINIANRLVASAGDTAVHLAANCEIGANYSGTIYSGDLNHGMQIGMTSATRVWTHLRNPLIPGHDRYMGFYDTYQDRIAFSVDPNYTAYFPGPTGSIIAERRAQGDSFGNSALILQASGAVFGTGNLDNAAMSFHVPAHGVATILKVLGPNGPALEVRNSADTDFVPVKASAFLVSSAIDTKTEVQPVDDSALDQLLALKPVSFKRREHACSLCEGTGKVKAQAVGLSDPTSTTKIKQKTLTEGQACVVCKGKAGTPRKGKAAKEYEQTPFVGLIAEDTAEVSSELVSWGEKDGKAVPDAIDYAAITALTVAGLQNALDRITSLENLAASSVDS